MRRGYRSTWLKAKITGMPLSESASVRLATQLSSLALLLHGTSPKALERRPAPAKWSARENLAHLARYHEICVERIERIVAEEKPKLPRYRAEDDPAWPAWAALPAEEVLRRLERLRAKLIRRIEQLSPKQFERIGVHSRFGEMTLQLWIEFFLLHEAHHLYVVLQRLREKD